VQVSFCIQIAGQEVEATVVGTCRHTLASNGCLLVAGLMSDGLGRGDRLITFSVRLALKEFIVHSRTTVQDIKKITLHGSKLLLTS
jgi:hypothetical protein